MPSMGQRFIDEVYAVLPSGQGLRVREVRKLLGRGTPQSVRIGLAALVDEGRATFTGKDSYRLYRRAEQEQQVA